MLNVHYFFFGVNQKMQRKSQGADGAQIVIIAMLGYDGYLKLYRFPLWASKLEPIFGVFDLSTPIEAHLVRH